MPSANKYKMTSKEAAEYLGINEATLRDWRITGRHRIPFVKIGRSVRYAEGDLKNYIQSRTKTHT